LDGRRFRINTGELFTLLKFRAGCIQFSEKSKRIRAIWKIQNSLNLQSQIRLRLVDERRL